MSVFYMCVSTVSVCAYVCVCFVADYKRGFGGQYGVEVEKQDQCALGYEHKESLAKHESQKGTDTSPITPTTPPPISKPPRSPPTLLLTEHTLSLTPLPWHHGCPPPPPQ